MAKKRLMRARLKPEDKPKAGRPAEKLSGDDVLGRRIPRGEGACRKWWVCTNWRDREQSAKEGGRLVREYEWSGRCACGRRITDQWHAYTLPPVSGHKLPGKCDACNDRVTGRDRAVSVDEPAEAVSSAPARAMTAWDILMDDCYWPSIHGKAVKLDWSRYSTADVRQMHQEMTDEGMAIPEGMKEFLGLVAEPAVEAVAPVVVEAEPVPEAKPEWELEADEHIDRTEMNEWHAPDWGRVDSRAIAKMVSRGRIGLRVPHSLRVYIANGGKGIVKNG